MLRETNIQRLHWADKTMSLLRQSQLESCERRLSRLPAFGLYTSDDDLHAEELWSLSLDAQSAPRQTHLHTTQELRAMVLARLPLEATLLTMDEHSLVERLITLGGEAELLDWLEMSAAETLVRRLWCTIRRDEDRFILHLPSQLRTPLLLVLSDRRHDEARSRLQRHDAIIRALLYLGGLLHFSEPLERIVADVLLCKEPGKQEYALATRYLQAAYDFFYDRDGEMILLHPGLAEPERLFSAMPQKDSAPLELDEDTIRGAMEGLMPEERQLFTRLYGLLSGATRPEISVEEAVEDLRMLVKQGVSLPVMREVLSSMLTIQPTAEMLRAVDELYLMTPRWGALQMNRLQ
ncbi:MAG: hypothetical protein IJE07_14730 [Clostridia bacterium]|nr:hypothetical protein [Clostridia bacterium]